MCADSSTDKKQYLANVKCHLSPITNVNSHRPLLTTPLCTVGWFAKTGIFDFGKKPICPKKPKTYHNTCG